ncbi:MAG TPA: MBL fold metallo-hydrolase [Vicinamibacterales bacterium]|jgi:glyoxylase-like metal-dependent hydrolase (beta-lactamase superfamily II)|nr:MBL fold metallo-hydrolase [Vicinamibacterales bacterium]
MTSRHLFRLARGAAWGVAFGVAASTVSAQQPQPGAGGGRGGAPQPLAVHQLQPTVYWIEGGGGNSAVIVGSNGVIVVDAKTSAAGATELLADIAKITPKPVTTVFLTHSDGDHVNGLASFPKGIAIIAQENCKTEMQAAPNAAAGGALADYMPTRTVTRNMEDLTIEGVHLRVYHFAPAHTSGDLMVYLPDDKIMFTGDIVATQTPYPLIHLEKNGTSDGWLTTMNGILATDATTFVPGHGDVQTKADLQKRVADTIARRDQIKALVAQGKSLDEIRASLGEQPPAARGGGGGGAGRGAAFPNFQDFTAVAVAEQTHK